MNLMMKHVENTPSEQRKNCEKKKMLRPALV